jgi:hypothetical protein
MTIDRIGQMRMIFQPHHRKANVMDLTNIFKTPSTYAAIGVIISAIPQLIATGFMDPTAWAAIAASVIAIFTKSRSDQAK